MVFFTISLEKSLSTSEDLTKIEKECQKLLIEMLKLKRGLGKKKAINHFLKIGEKYKAEIIESIPKEEEISIYHHGKTWHDLCRGRILHLLEKLEKLLN